jgi:hypothetical protein
VFGAFVAQRDSFVSGMQMSLAIGAILLLVTMLASLRLAGKNAYACNAVIGHAGHQAPTR